MYDKNNTVITNTRLFIDWIAELKQVTADKMNIDPNEVKINEDEAFKYFKDGYTPTQCFREEI